MMEESQIRSAIWDDPSWFLYGYDWRTDQLALAKVDDEVLTRSAFLDKRLFPHLDRVLTVSAGEISGHATHQSAYIFHTAFCGSTLFARALHSPPSTFSLKEPSALLALAILKHERPTLFKSRLALVNALLARPRPTASMAVIKPTNQVNTIALDILKTCTGRALFMYSSFEEFLISSLKKRPQADTLIRWMAQHLLRDSRLAKVLGVDWRNQFSFPEACALTWLAQMQIISEILSSEYRDRVRTMDFRALLDNPSKHVATASEWLGLSLSESQIENGTQRALRNDSKSNQTFDAENHNVLTMTVKNSNAEFIEAVLSWVEDKLATAVAAPAWQPLVATSTYSFSGTSLPIRQRSY